MPLPKKQLRPEQIRLAAAFAEPVYERLQILAGDSRRQLLAFVNPLPVRLEQRLRSEGAEPSGVYHAPCYSAVWELPESWCSRSPADFMALDQAIAAELRVQNGKYSSTAGDWFMEPRQLTRQTSSLLLEAQEPACKSLR